MSEILAEAPVRAKSGPESHAKASASTHNEDASSRFRKAADLLREAWLCNDDEAEAACYSGDSDRLLLIAANYASDVGDLIGQGDLMQEAFNVSALISAARMVPGDVEGPTRKALLDRVAPLLRPIASPDGGAEEFGQPLAPRPERPSPLDEHEQTVVATLHDLMGKAADAQTLPGPVATLMDIVDFKLDEPVLKDGTFDEVAAILAGMLSLLKGSEASSAEAINAISQARDLAEAAFLTYAGGGSPAEACAEGIRSAQLVAMKAPDPSKALNACQLTTVLRTIASRMDQLNSLLVYIQCTNDLTEAMRMIDAAQAMSIYVGGMADQASGSNVVGDANVWSFGRDFADLGKAGAA